MLPVYRNGEYNRRTQTYVLTRDRILQAGSAAGAALLGLLGVVVQDLNVLLGLDCSPISVVGVGSGSECSASPVCCENNDVVSHIFPRSNIVALMSVRRVV